MSDSKQIKAGDSHNTVRDKGGSIDPKTGCVLTAWGQNSGFTSDGSKAQPS